VWEFLFKYPTDMFARGEITLSASAWLYLGLVLAAAVAIPTLLYYRRATRSLHTVDRAVLALTRTAAIAILVLALFQPVLTVTNVVSERNVVAILLDDSVSMRIADHDGEPRARFLRTAFHPQTGTITSALSRRLEPRLFRFAGGIAGLDAHDGMTFAGPRTDLGRALDDLRNAIELQSLAALVVVTDGAVTRATALDEKLSAYRAADVPVSTVGVGQSTFARDIEVSAVSMPRRTLEGSSIVADVAVSQRGFDGATVKLLVEDEGEPIAIEEITFGADQPVRTVRTRFTAKTPGARRLRFSITPAADEVLAENNSRQAVLDVDGERQRILYFEGEPRFELKFVRRAVAGDENLRLVSMVRTAENKYYRLGIDDPQELAEGFPKTAEELFAYRGLILGSVEAGYFSASQLELIADFVSRRGGGLLMLGGRRALSRGGYGNTPVGDLLPVVLDAARDDAIRANVSVQPTPAGYGHPIGGIARAEDGSPSWDGLPPLTVLHPLYRTKPGAATLLEGAAPNLPTPLTVLAEQRYGRGQALVLNVQNAWTWQMHQDVPPEDQTHETLWRQLLRWLVRAVPDAVSVRTGSEHASAGETVEVTAEVLDPAFHPRNDAGVTLVVNTPIGDRLTLPMTWDATRDGTYRVQLTPEHAGLYEMTVEARAGETLTKTSASLAVGMLVPDHYGAEMRETFLQRIATDTGGRFFKAGDAASLADQLPLSKSGASVEERLALWDMPALFLLLIALVGFEWLYRRWRGLV
jgi:uncharacterized membrane protein